MDAIGGILLSPWLSEEDREKVQNHSKENFLYVRYFNMPKGRIKTGRLNKITRELMWVDPPPTVGFKQCLLLVCHIPYAAGYLLIHLVKCVYHVAGDVLSLRFKKSVEEIANRTYGVIRTSYYMLGMAVALFLGILIDPIKAREAYGLLDFHHNGDVEYSNSYTRLIGKDISCWEAVNKTEACYFACCMQPKIRNFDEVFQNDRRYRVIQESDKMEEIDWDENNDGQTTENVYHDWFIYPILPCLRRC